MNPILIVAIVFGAGFLMMIPFYIAQTKRKNKEKDFLANNKDKAILRLYSDSSKIDGVDVKKLNYIKGEMLEGIVALEAGTHSFEGRFSTTSVDMGRNVNYKTEKLKFDIALEAGHNYTLAVYFYSPEERKSYYKGDVGEDVFTLELGVTGGNIGSYTKAYIICYKED